MHSSVVTSEFTCNGQIVRLVSMVLARGANPANIVGAARAAAETGLGEDLDTQVWRASVPGAPPWMLVRARQTGQAAAYAVEVDGVQGVGSLHDRIKLVRDMFGRTDRPPPIARVVKLVGSPGEEDALKAVLSGMTQ